MGEWQPIETAPKAIETTIGVHRYGPNILAISGTTYEVTRWWDANEREETKHCNWIDGGGNAWRPTHWMPLPDPPTAEDLSRDAALAELARLTQECPE